MRANQNILRKNRIEKEAPDNGIRFLPLVSVITPAYNESDILVPNLERLYDYMTKLEDEFRWELVIVNDGSSDNTGALAEEFANERDKVRVLHHIVNRNLGGALQTGFENAKGDYIVVMDIDLSYSEDHIEQLLSRITETDADMVIASPYMKGGRSTAVPPVRLFLSKAVNRIMRFMSPQTIYTFTGMVRVYKGDFIRKLNLKSITYTINTEIIYKAFVLRARIEEIPGHLDWSFHKYTKRTSGIRIASGVLAGLMSGFIFRPYVFFMSIGMGLLLISMYIITWIFIHTFSVLPEIAQEMGHFEDRFGMAVAKVFLERPYSFMVGGITLIVALQFLGIGFLSLQNKRYFEELFHLNSRLENRKKD